MTIKYKCKWVELKVSAGAANLLDTDVPTSLNMQQTRLIRIPIDLLEATGNTSCKISVYKRSNIIIIYMCCCLSTLYSPAPQSLNKEVGIYSLNSLGEEGDELLGLVALHFTMLDRSTSQ